MQIAVLGWAGCGKTTVAAGLVHSLAARGETVLAIDAARAPQLALALGLERTPAAGIAIGSGPGRASAAGGYGMRPVAGHADWAGALQPLPAAGVQLLVLHGQHAGGERNAPCACAADLRTRVRERALEGPAPTYQVLDLDAGLAGAQRGEADEAELWLVVLEPYYRALEAAARLHALALDRAHGRCLLVANKVRDESDRAAIGAFCERRGLGLAAALPYEGEVERGVGLSPEAAGWCKGMQELVRLI